VRRNEKDEGAWTKTKRGGSIVRENMKQGGRKRKWEGEIDKISEVCDRSGCYPLGLISVLGWGKKEREKN